MKEIIKCKDCWWLHFNPQKSEEKGQCLAYGFFINKNSEICCEFARGCKK